MKEQNILKAAMIAAEWHSEQRRKGEKAEPYINHLIEVAQLVSVADPGNANLIVAALLHDAVEDQNKSREEIAALFGESGASLVDEVTDKPLPRLERKRLQIETAPKKSRDAKLLKLADKTSNLRSIAKSPPVSWSDDRRHEYVIWATAVANGLVGISEWLDRQFEEAKALALQSIPNESA